MYLLLLFFFLLPFVIVLLVNYFYPSTFTIRYVASMASSLAAGTTPLTTALSSSIIDVCANLASAPVATSSNSSTASTAGPSITASVRAVAAGVLIGAVAGDAPVTISTVGISMAAQRQTPTELLTSNQSLTGSGGGGGVALPITLFDNLFGSNSSAIPAAIDSTMIQYANNVYGDTSSSTPSRPTIVSYSLAVEGVPLAVQNLSKNILITIPYNGISKSYKPSCRYWDSVCCICSSYSSSFFFFTVCS
jgi:hypothetical protein